MLRVKPREPIFYSIYINSIDERNTNFVNEFIKECDQLIPSAETKCFAVLDEEEKEILVQSDFGSIEVIVKENQFLVFKYVFDIPYFEFQTYNADEFRLSFEVVS